MKSGQDPNLVKQNILINKQVDQLNTFKAVAEEWLLMKEKEWKPFVRKFVRIIHITS